MFLKDSPEKYGVKPMWNDKVKIADESGAIIPYGVTSKEAYKSVQFWCGTIGIGLFGLIIYGAICNIAIFSSDLGYDGGVMLSVMYAANIVLQLPFGILADKLGILSLKIKSFSLTAQPAASAEQCALHSRQRAQR